MNSDPAITPVNMHMHTHFSYNAHGLSPAQLVEEAVGRGLYAAAICDFDVLDGLEEFYEAADRRGLRAAVGMETRVFFPEYADKEINSPGEPGVYYFMGMGFGSVPAESSPAGRTLRELRERSAQRNRALIGRINAALPEIALDYDRDVLPLTPSGNATERHIVAAYARKARAADSGHKGGEERGAAVPARRIWERVTGLAGEKLDAARRDEVALHNAVRSRLIKSGGVGYARPDASTFPPIDDAIALILDARAMPMATWLNGLSDGEKNIAAQLELLRAKGVVALNIIPDRNWNIADAKEREIKVRRLHDLVEVARRMDLPLNVGTEVNAPGQPMVDDFETEAMRPLWQWFIRGANVVVGQARLLRFADFSYCGPEAAAEFGADLARKNDFFMRVGTLPPPSGSARDQLQAMSRDRAFAAMRDSAKQGEWTVG
jgi:hypothetical protein